MTSKHLVLGVVFVLTACGAEPAAAPGGDTAAAPEGAALEELAEILGREVARVETRAEEIDAIFQPLPLLTPGEEAELRRFGNAQQLERARALGVSGDRSEARLEALVSQGGLVRLEDGEHWVVRDLDYSQPLVVPAMRELLTEIADRFHARLAALGAPPFRVEISSALRSAEDQARLRAVNPNAVAGESTHEYGTTVDVAYNAFAAPAQPIVGLDAPDAEALRPYLTRYAEVTAERIAARRSLELKAILGEVLLGVQREGRVMVTLERQQPVFHMTVAR